ncbi:MAG: MFS transporter [Candidatus Dormibacteria bacterium]
MAGADVAIAPRRRASWSNPGLRQLSLLSIYWVAIGWLWNALGAQVLPPVIARMVGNAHKGTALSVLEGFGTLVAVVWQPVVGALSDRTRLRWGRRRPYIAGGALGSSLFLVIMAFVGAYYWLLIVYFLLQVASNTAQAPYQGLGPDAIPEKDFGRFGAFYGMGNLAGTLIGFVVTGIFTASGQYGRALFAMAAMLVVSMALTVTLVPDRGRPDRSLRMGLGDITVGTFRISPRRHGNFLWLMGSRLLILMGVVGLETYAQFFFKDVFYPGSSTALTNHANAATTYLLAIIVVLAIAICYPAGRISDRWGRKPMVIVCAVLGALGGLGLVFAHYPILPGAMTAPVASLLGIPRGLAQVLWFGVPIGVGIGCFLTVDWAFMVDLIPPAEFGRFLGFSNIATAGSGIIARFIAGPVLDHFNAGGHILGELGGYPVVFGMFVVYFVAGIFLVLPVNEPRRRGRPVAGAPA